MEQLYSKNEYNSTHTIELSKSINDDEKIIDKIESLKDIINSYLEILESDDNDLIEELKDEIKKTENEINILELETKFNSKDDNKNAIIEIHSGAGGTESCDWASMLFRMYTRWIEKKGFKYEVLDSLAGEEAGIKKIIMLVSGKNVYGYLKCENGVHRLVRLSPFDSNNRRHTSFAAVQVLPEVDDEVV